MFLAQFRHKLQVSTKYFFAVVPYIFKIHDPRSILVESNMCVFEISRDLFKLSVEISVDSG